MINPGGLGCKSSSCRLLVKRIVKHIAYPPLLQWLCCLGKGFDWKLSVRGVLHGLGKKWEHWLIMAWGSPQIQVQTLLGSHLREPKFADVWSASTVFTSPSRISRLDVNSHKYWFQGQKAFPCYSAEPEIYCVTNIKMLKIVAKLSRSQVCLEGLAVPQPDRHCHVVWQISLSWHFHQYQ